MALAAVSAQALDADGGAKSELSAAQMQAMAANIQQYWTPERMAGAVPMPAPVKVIDENDIFSVSDPVAEPPGPPGYSPGWAPGSGPQPEVLRNTPSSPIVPQSR